MESKKENMKLAKLKAAQKVTKRAELQRELNAQAKVRSELDKIWKKIMLDVKVPLLRQDIEVMWHTLDRAYDKKDYLIAQTVSLMWTADDQFQRTVASSCDTVDTMIINFLEEMEELSKENSRRTAKLLKLGEAEAASIMSDHNAAETHLQLLIYDGHTKADELAWTKRGEDLVKKDEDNKKIANQIENLRSFLENDYSVMWNEYKAVLKAYIAGTAENQKLVRKLRQKEVYMSDIIALQAKKIANSDGLLKRLRAELAGYESGTKQAIFRERRDRYRKAFQQMKKCMVDGCALDNTQMDTLVIAINNAVSWLSEGHTKIERILRITALCRKYETVREKVLPYGTTRLHSPIDVKALKKRGYQDALIINELSSTCGLTRLWQRISKVELTKRALLREKENLEKENALIMYTLQDHKNKSIGSDDSKACKCKAAVKKGTANFVTNNPTTIPGIMKVCKPAYLKRTGDNYKELYIGENPHTVLSNMHYKNAKIVNGIK